METVQLVIRDSRYAASLQELLERSGHRRVHCVEAPDLRQPGVIVVDSDGLDRLPSPLLNPERVVLITRNDPHHLSQAWQAGIRSVVFSEDNLNTAVLAIMAAELRVSKPDLRVSGGGMHSRERKG
jgi:riboflavin biosynthesis pyrimidine reductase